MNGDKRPLIVLAILVALVAGVFILRPMLQSDSTDAQPNDPAITVAPDSPAQSSSTTTTAKPGALKDELPAAINRVTQTENALFHNPDPAGVDSIMLPECSCYADTKQRLTNLKQKGWYVSGDNLVITASSVIKIDSPTRVEMLVNISTPGLPVVDATGKEMESGGDPGTASFLYILQRGSDNYWRVASRDAA